MGLIRILPENVISQIAAGEVIERPSSVLRELVDNSIDAGTDTITARIERGGKGLIRLSDNGCGMSREDLLLCAERHATSKIESISDLFTIRSLGFRGEALPSIGSVSRMSITSRSSDDLVGHRLRIEGGKSLGIEETGCPAGTIVEVRDLFYNLPARRKFLKAERTETDHITEMLLRASISFPGVRFKLQSGSREVVNLPPAKDQLQRISAMLGKEVAESMKGAHQEDNEISITAYLGDPEFSRSRADRLLVYVNGRNIRDRIVNKAIMEGYGQRLMKGRYPQAVVFLEMDPSLVDMNVHPAKQEVRFNNGRSVFNALVSLIRKALDSRDGEIFFGPSELPGIEENFLTRPSAPRVSEPEVDYKDREGEYSADYRQEGITRYDGGGGVRVIGQLGNTYIICETQEGFLLVDQHAAHERIVYEDLKEDFYRSSIESQALLVPIQIDLAAKDRRVLEEKSDELMDLGIEIEHFGGNTFLLRSVPALMGDVNWKAFLPEIISSLEEGGSDRDHKLEKMIILMACHSAVRAGKRMTLEEMENLIGQLEEMDLPANCPHGRPVFRRFSFSELEKMFKRVV